MVFKEFIEEQIVESLFVLVAMIAVGYWLYRSGKRIGSVYGFNAGRGRRAWRRRK